MDSHPEPGERLRNNAVRILALRRFQRRLTAEEATALLVHAGSVKAALATFEVPLCAGASPTAMLGVEPTTHLGEAFAGGDTRVPPSADNTSTQAGQRGTPGAFPPRARARRATGRSSARGFGLRWIGAAFLRFVAATKDLLRLRK